MTRDRLKRLTIFYYLLIVLSVLIMIVFILVKEPSAVVRKIGYVYQNEEMVNVLTENPTEIQTKVEDEKLATNEIIKVNVEGTIADYSKVKLSQVEINDLIEKQRQARQAYEIKLSNESIYVDDLKHFDWAIDQIVKAYVPYDWVYQGYRKTKEIPNYEYKGKKYISLQLDETYEISEVIVQEKEIIKTKEKVLYSLMHKNQEQETIRIKEDETIEEIIEENDLDEYTYSINNPAIMKGGLIAPGEQLVVNELDSLIDLEVTYNEVKEEVVEYQVERKEDSKLRKGEQRIIQEGEAGLREVTYQTKEVNNKVIEIEEIASDVTQPPVSKIIIEGTRVIPGVGTGDWAWPAATRNITCPYGCYYGHQGVDVQSWYGSPLKAADNGVVVFSGYNGGYGWLVRIDHQNGYETYYGHQNGQPPVRVGQVVEKGQVIGYEGNSGQSTGHHLHFEIRRGGLRLNPLTFY